MELVAEREVAHGVANYLGVIVSRDRGTIYWVNNTKPIP